MKNQYFADNRDYFKYDLWLDIAEGLKAKRLTLIPMLTPYEPKNEGSQTSFPEGKGRKRLHGFLKFCLVPNRRSVVRLREFLCDEPFEYHPYRDEDDKGFQDGSWDAYFSAVPREWLCDAAILIDPDVGLETLTDHWKDSPEKHATNENILSIVRRCSGNSAVVVFQFLQKAANKREADLVKRSKRLQERLQKTLSGVSVRWIAEKTTTGLGELAFIVIGTGPGSSSDVDRLLKGYARTHDRRLGAVQGAERILA